MVLLLCQEDYRNLERQVAIECGCLLERKINNVQGKLLWEMIDGLDISFGTQAISWTIVTSALSSVMPLTVIC